MATRAHSLKVSKRMIAFLVAVFLVFLFSVLFVNSVQPSSGIDLSEGWNNLTLNFSSSFNASSLMKLNPEIEVVFYNGENGTIGYANIFGGIGKDFNIEKGVRYGVYSSKNATLILPN